MSNRIQFIVKWQDADGKHRSRAYDTDPEAKRAEKWLKDNGAANIDIAVRLNNTEHTVTAKEDSPLQVATQQPLTDAWYNK